MTSNYCIVCAGSGADQLYAGILKCRTCGHVYADMCLTDEELLALYNEQFFSGAEFSDYAADERFFRKNFRLRSKKLRGFLDPARHQRLLEIGSAYGFFLDEVRTEFTSVQVIDITEADRLHGRARVGLCCIHVRLLP